MRPAPRREHRHSETCRRVDESVDVVRSRTSGAKKKCSIAKKEIWPLVEMTALGGRGGGGGGGGGVAVGGWSGVVGVGIRACLLQTLLDRKPRRTNVLMCRIYRCMHAGQTSFRVLPGIGFVLLSGGSSQEKGYSIILEPSQHPGFHAPSRKSFGFWSG